MEFKCKKPIVDFGGNVLFNPNITYKAKGISASKQITLVDELGGWRQMPTTGIEGKFFKEHFDEVKEKVNE